MLFSCLFLFFNFISPKHCWHFLSFLNTVTISSNLRVCSWFIGDLPRIYHEPRHATNKWNSCQSFVTHKRSLNSWGKFTLLEHFDAVKLPAIRRPTLWMLRQQINHFIRIKCCITLEEMFKYLHSFVLFFLSLYSSNFVLFFDD